MSRRIRTAVTGLVSCALLVVHAAPALAGGDQSILQRSNEIPVLLDATILRPLGIVTMAVGMVGFAAIAPLVAITRPTDLHKPFKTLVLTPARFTFVDPLGHHPDRRRADYGELE